MALLEDSLGLVEARCGWVFPDPPPAKEKSIGVLERLLIAAGLKKGNGRVKMMRLTIDPVNVLPRPFFMYWVPGMVNWYLKTRVYARLGTTVVSHDPVIGTLKSLRFAHTVIGWRR
jgi:hypothetical protein